MVSHCPSDISDLKHKKIEVTFQHKQPNLVSQLRFDAQEYQTHKLSPKQVSKLTQERYTVKILDLHHKRYKNRIHEDSNPKKLTFRMTA
jgi:hypothetical protein